MKKSIASLKERLSDWMDWDGACYEVGACLGFWPDFGATHDQDCWHGAKGIIWSANPLGNAISDFLEGLVLEGMLEREESGPSFRWNPEYKGLDNE